MLSPQPSALSPEEGPPAAARMVALTEVLLCSGYPTQIALGTTLSALGVTAETPQHGLRIGYVVGISIADSIAVIGLALLFVWTHGERPRDVFLGDRPVLREALAGVPLIIVALGIAALALTALQQFVPSLHTVEHNPLQELMKSPRNAWLFVVVALVAGGLREEVQRAF